MAFEITSKVKVQKDGEGKVRRIRHPRQSYSGADAGLAAAAARSPRSLADEYVRDVLPILELDTDMAENLSAAVSAEVEADRPRLRFLKEKAVKNQCTVSYAQTALGLPVWESGLTIRMQGDPPVITSSENSIHYDQRRKGILAPTRFLTVSLNLTGHSI